MAVIKKILAWACIVAGVLFEALAFLGPAPEGNAADGKNAVIVIGALAIIAGIGLLSRRARGNERAIKSGKPGAYTTKRCPACCETIPLEAQFCEHCGKKQREGDSTCSGNVSLTAAQARSFFAGERANAKKLGSTHYIWRSCKDGARCERCANNDGHVFAWDEEPEGGHAGAKARCRCYPEAVLPKS